MGELTGVIRFTILGMILGYYITYSNTKKALKESSNKIIERNLKQIKK